ncbi:MAG: serine hydrolase [Maribacter sp.]
MLKNSLVFVFLLGVLVQCTQAQNPAIPESVKANVHTRVTNGSSAGIAIGVIDAQGTHVYNYGVKSLKTKDPVDEHSVFEIGSISKTFTGLLLADLVTKGELQLTTPLQDLLPSGVTAPTRNGEAITLVHMSNHTSSLPRLPDNMRPANPNNPYADYSEEQLYEFLSRYQLPRDIGSQYEYSNYAAGHLGHVLAAHQQMSYEELLLKTIARPLGMENTGITLTPNMKENLAMGHSGPIQVENWDLSTLAGAGGIRSTVVDMLNYVSANMGTKQSDLYPAMQLSHTNTRKTGAVPQVGLGWHITKHNSREFVWHNGGTGGYRTFIGFVKGDDKGVVVLSNSNASIDNIGYHLLDQSWPLVEVKPSIASKLRPIIDNQGITEGIKTYWQLKKDASNKINFEASELNSLGYGYLAQNELEKAIAVFQLNVEAYPEASNPYDSLGEAYAQQGDTDKAITNYKKSVALNPANQSGIEALKKLGVATEGLVKEIVVDGAILQSYVGQYELAPNFILTVTKEGSQLSAQATGQMAFPVFPKSDSTFYYKVVAAELVFNFDAKGTVQSVTLHQGGQVIIGKKL